MDLLLIIIGVVLLLTGIAGCFIPGIPGAPLSYVGLLMLHITERYHLSSQLLIIYFIAVIIVAILDYALPILGSKWFGATRKGFIGSIIGLVAGIFLFPPFGIIIGPFAGAVIAEIINGMETKKAVKAGFGTFVGFLTGTLIELILCLFMTYHFIIELIRT
ncbi:MAG: DUF456 domain-containing protein [Bacteroidia bacterium]